MRKPAITLIAVPGRRQQTIDVAVEADRQGFPGVWIPSPGEALGLSGSLAMATENIQIATSIQPIYLQNASGLASYSSYLNEVSGGRFVLGLGVSHEPAMDRVGVINRGKPLSDIRQYVTDLRAADPKPDDPALGLPPLMFAALRNKMIALSVELGVGTIFANISVNDAARAVAQIPAERREAGYQIANMIPTIIDDDKEAAANRHRASLQGYAMLPNYRNYWRQAGFEEEMDAFEAAIADQNPQRIPELMSDRWLSSVTLYGPAAEVRDKTQEWFDAGVNTPILVPGAVKGGHLGGARKILETFAD
ncbi:LLM class flavin-dependent oxidoreductase [Cumulibacter soli]|uniref:LLM class flavin-dependent oxidoreductase n=1 Tax=Cumulibacter soli TaxID=2546344 RepID=UPI001067B4A5|nr:LLM class flavin-dependent oxidoreductase [Cumulibacter soli]